MLRIHDVCQLLIVDVAPIANSISRHDSDLAKQLRRALSSVPLNIAEGSEQRGARRNSHYTIALGSAHEAQSALTTAVSWGYIKPPPNSVTDRFQHIIGTLTNLTKQH